MESEFVIEEITKYSDPNCFLIKVNSQEGAVQAFIVFEAENIKAEGGIVTIVKQVEDTFILRMEFPDGAIYYNEYRIFQLTDKIVQRIV